MAFETIGHYENEPRKWGKVNRQLEELYGSQGGDEQDLTELQQAVSALQTNALTTEQRAAVDALEPEDTADATDEGSAVTLANALKAKVNEIIAALQAAPEE